MAYIVLENGAVFRGESIGAPADSVGELVFATGVVGYLETLSDPSYAGQIVMQTFPLIGNYGVIEEDLEGSCAVRGYIVRELCHKPSNFRSQYELDAFLKDRGVCGVCGVDTRELTRILREEGAMNAMICQSLPEDLAALKSYRVENAVAQVSCKAAYTLPAEGEKRYSVALMDYGAKRNIIRSLRARGCEVTVLPWDSSAETVLALAPDGLMLSNGPGDPAENTRCIEQIAKLLGRLPIFGICLGHQLVALAAGGRTEKLKYGHRGANQPVCSVDTGRSYVTCQNHGYAVLADSLRGLGRQSFYNLNDLSCEGMDYPSLNCYTLQFHPEACAGSRDTAFLFDRFIAMMGGGKNA